MNRQQQDFLERLALRIPSLFDAIAQGNVKSEYIIGVRYIGARHVRLKLVAEVVDPGANPLATHSQTRSGTQSPLRSTQSPLRSVDMSALSVGGSLAMPAENSDPDPEPGPAPASRRRRSRKR